MIVWSFLGNSHVVRVTFPQPGVGHANEPCFLFHVGNCRAAAVAHRRAQSADHLVHRIAQRPFVRHSSFNAFGNKFLQIVLAAASEVERPVFFSLAIIVAAYIPLLSLTSIEGLLFRPMALTVIAALTGSLAASLTVIPVLASLMLPARAGTSEGVPTLGVATNSPRRRRRRNSRLCS